MGSEYKGYGGGGSVTGYERDNGVSDRGSEVEGFGTPAGLNTNVSSVTWLLISALDTYSQSPHGWADNSPLQLQAKLHDYRPTVEGNLETSALGLTFRVTKQGREIDALERRTK